MQKERTTTAVELYLQSRILEAYSIAESLLEEPPSEGISAKIATAITRLAQYEQALQSLQRNRIGLIEGPAPAQPESVVPTPVEVEEDEDEHDSTQETITVSEENSPTFKRSQKYRNVSTQESDES